MFQRANKFAYAADGGAGRRTLDPALCYGMDGRGSFLWLWPPVQAPLTAHQGQGAALAGSVSEMQMVLFLHLLLALKRHHSMKQQILVHSVTPYCGEWHANDHDPAGGDILHVLCVRCSADGGAGGQQSYLRGLNCVEYCIVDVT